MPNKITTQQLFDQYIAMNEKLESMEQKLDSVIKDDSVNTRLTGSIVEKIYLENVEIPANSSVQLYNLPKLSPEFSVGIRFEQSANFRVRFTDDIYDPWSTLMSFGDSLNPITGSDSDKGFGYFEKTHGNGMSIQVINDSDYDITSRALAVCFVM